MVEHVLVEEGTLDKSVTSCSKHLHAFCSPSPSSLSPEGKKDGWNVLNNKRGKMLSFSHWSWFVAFNAYNVDKVIVMPAVVIVVLILRYLNKIEMKSENLNPDRCNAFFVYITPVLWLLLSQIPFLSELLWPMTIVTLWSTPQFKSQVIFRLCLWLRKCRFHWMMYV